jgi:hypothetical protein
MRQTVITLLAAILLVGCSPTGTLTKGQISGAPDQVKADLLKCQMDEYIQETGSTGAEAGNHFADLVEKHGGKDLDHFDASMDAAQAELWNEGYGEDFCSMFHPNFEGEE